MRYERLRAGQHRGEPASRERELFIQCGMLGWLEVWAEYAPLPNPPPGEGVRLEPASAPLSLSVPLSGTVTEVLGAMAWAVLG